MSAPKGLRFRQLLLGAYLKLHKSHKEGRASWYEAKKWLERRLIDPPRYKGTLPGRELGSWRCSAKLQLELQGEEQEEVDWHGAFWDLFNRSNLGGRTLHEVTENHRKRRPAGEHLKMKASDLLRLLDAVEGR